jgi:hypothetical protein
MDDRTGYWSPSGTSVWYVCWGDEHAITYVSNRLRPKPTAWQRVKRWVEGQYYYYDEYLPGAISSWIGYGLYRLADRYADYLCRERW